MSIYNDNLHKGANRKLYEYGRALRQEKTEAEEKLWQHLSGKKLNGLKFRRHILCIITLRISIATKKN